MTEQLQSRIDLHNQALLDSEKYQREVRDKDLSLTELKTIIQQLEQDLQERTLELEHSKQVGVGSDAFSDGFATCWFSYSQGFSLAIKKL